MSAEDLASERAKLKAVIEPWPNVDRLVSVVLDVWPEHCGYLANSFAIRSKALMASADHISRAILELAGARTQDLAEDYRWLCDQIKGEELEFARNGRYRYSTFAETNANVYSDVKFMDRYMHGLLYSHVLWFMHASSLQFFKGRCEARFKSGGKVLEIGPGHGLLLYLALNDLGFAEAHAWDLSEASLAQTRDALARLSSAERAVFARQDMHKIESQNETFDLIILSHILEHLEEPVRALASVKRLLTKNGLIFVNVPLNAPMPDHIVLLETPEEAINLLNQGGFRVLEFASHTTQGLSLRQALRRKVAVTCSILAEPA